MRKNGFKVQLQEDDQRAGPAFLLDLIILSQTLLYRRPAMTASGPPAALCGTLKARRAPPTPRPGTPLPEHDAVARLYLDRPSVTSMSS
jgi:hypothetical protein